MIVNFNNPNQYYMSLLTQEQSLVYSIILDGIRNFKDEISIPPISRVEMSKIWEYIMLDNPLIFYTRDYVQMVNPQEMVKAVSPTYELSKQTAKEHLNEIIKHMLKFSSIGGKNQIEKELFIHDQCTSKLTYDASIGSNAYTILGPILNKAAVCEGISKYAKLAFDYVGMKSLVVTGELKKPTPDTPEGHAWNIVEVGNKPYHLDITLNLTIMGKMKRYDYFNLSDKNIKKDHVILSNVPVCSTEGKDYYSEALLVMNSFEMLSRHIANCLKKGKKSILIRMGDNFNSIGLEAMVMKIAKDEYTAITNNGFEIEISSNEYQMVYEIHYKKI